MTDFSDYVPGTRNWTATFTGDALVWMWGAGGGGAGGTALAYGGGGGGGGALVVSVIPVVSGVNYPYTVGAGGAGGAWAGGDGGNGGNTQWATGSAHKAAGGKGATNQNGALGGLVADCLGDSKYPGGAGGSNDGYVGGYGGAGAGSGGGVGGISTDQHEGNPGTSPGGGGSGGGQLSDGVGGAGADGGIVIVQAPTVDPGYYLVGYDGSTYDDPGTVDWTAPGTGVVVVQCMGSGGGARGGNGFLGASGAGGGAYSQKAVSVTEGTVYERVIPAPGSGAAYNSSGSTDGADAIFRLKASPFTELVKAKGGLRSTGTSSGAAGGAGGAAGSGIGDVTNSGNNGTAATGTTSGSAGGAGALPSGGAGGLGGNGTNGNPGGNGTVPGGGGGGGRGATGGSGGNGARGFVVISYFLTFGSVIIDGEEKFIVRIRFKDGGGVVREISKRARVVSGARVSLNRVDVDLTPTERAYPTYLPTGTEALFDRTRGTFNWTDGAPNTKPAILAQDFMFGVAGDSVSEGWTYLNNLPPYNFTADFPNAFPRWARNYVAEAVGAPIGGTGMIRSHSLENGDPQWDEGSWNDAGVHYLFTSGTSPATFTSIQKGTAIAVATCGFGTVTIEVDGVMMAGSAAGSSASDVVRTVVTGLSDDYHTVVIRRFSGTAVLISADCFYPDNGIRVHNMAQGGTTAAFDTGESSPQQDVWSDSAPGAPASMLATYSQQPDMYGRNLDAWVIMLGGNDSFRGFTASAIASAHDIIGTALDTADTDIILMPDVHSGDRMGALMDLCLTKDWALVDFYWLSQNLAAVQGQGYAGDTFGHLNVAGAKWAGRLLANAMLTGIV